MAAAAAAASGAQARARLAAAAASGAKARLAAGGEARAAAAPLLRRRRGRPGGQGFWDVERRGIIPYSFPYSFFSWCFYLGWGGVGWGWGWGWEGDCDESQTDPEGSSVRWGYGHEEKSPRTIHKRSSTTRALSVKVLHGGLSNLMMTCIADQSTARCSCYLIKTVMLIGGMVLLIWYFWVPNTLVWFWIFPYCTRILGIDWSIVYFELHNTSTEY